MTKLIFSLLFTLTFGFAIDAAATSTGGDAVVKEGTINYTVNTGDLDPSIAMMLQDMTLSVSFDQGNLKMDIRMMLGSMTTIVNGNENRTLSLIDMLGNKYAVIMDNELAPDSEVHRGDETIEIAGYKCRKVVVKSADTELVFYVTDRIKVPSVNAQFPVDKLGGYPLQMELQQGPLKMTMIANEVISTKFAKGTFDLVIPQGYTEKTPEELMEITGALGF